MSLIGFDLTTDPRIAVCSPIGVPPGGKNMQTMVDVRQESTGLMARSIAGAGDLVIRLEAAGTSTGSTIPIRGSATGTALWADPRFPTVDLRVRVDGMAAANGDLIRTASLITGQMTGTIVFSNSGGASSICPMVLWMMQPAR